MQLLGLILLIPLVLGVSTDVNPENADIEIDETTHTLKKVQQIAGKKNSTLDLEGLDLEVIDSEAFSNGWDDLKSLFLNNNSLYNLPPNVLKDLPNLEQLDLSWNVINSGHFYGESGSSLKTLKISNNPLATFIPGYFNGLTMTSIYTKDTPIKYISTGAFENYSSDFQDVPEDNPDRNWAKSRCRRDTIFNDWAEPHRASTFEAQYCVDRNTLVSIKARNQEDPLPPDCHRTSIVDTRLDLMDLNITDFQPGWYGLNGYDIRYIVVSRNKISDLTKSFVEHLPDGISIYLSGNMFKQVRQSQTFQDNVKYRIRTLRFGYNALTEIQTNALKNFDIYEGLDFSNNQLNNTEFLEELPLNISAVWVTHNNITEISAGNFKSFPWFSDLDLSHNKITALQNGTMNEFNALTNLHLSYNDINRIESNFFTGLKNLRVVELNDNNILRLEKGTFADLNNIEIINLARNCLTSLEQGLFSELPDSLRELHLDGNSISTITQGSFRNGPTVKLYLNYNKISTIEKGSFNISRLEFLDLSFNRLNQIDSESFEGIKQLDILSLKSNNISEIRKGMDKHLNTLFTLDLSENPIKQLDESALSGLSKKNRARVILDGVSIDSMHSKLFDES